MIIRKYQPKDRSRVEYIHFETFLIGKSIRPFVNDQKRFDEEIKYYLDKEPESCFVVEDKSKVVGYLLGCLDDKKNDEGTVKYFLKHLIILFQLPFMSSKDIKFCVAEQVFVWI